MYKVLTFFLLSYGRHCMQTMALLMPKKTAEGAMITELWLMTGLLEKLNSGKI